MSKTKLIICGRLFDGIHEEFFNHMEVLVEGNRITEVGKNLSRPKDIEIIDLSDATVTPGLIDNHIHSDFWEWQNRRVEMFTTSDEWKILSALYSAQNSLIRGFTTVRHLNIGIHGYGLADVKRAINAGYFSGSRVFVATHRLGSHGGHPDTSGYFRNNPRLSELTVQPGIGTGTDFFRMAVRKEIKYGSDVIKFMTTAGMFGPGYSAPICTPETEQLTDDETKAIIDTANMFGVPTTSHAYSPEQIIKLSEFGISCIEHAAFMNEEAAETMERCGTYLVPTFYGHDDGIYLDEIDITKKNDFARKRIEMFHEKLVNGREIILKSKIKLGFGTDIVSKYREYESWPEYAAMLKAGMDPFRALKAATSVNAEILRQPDLGVIAPGKLADIAAWRRDLLTDREALKECAFVMKDGNIYEPYHSTDAE